MRETVLSLQSYLLVLPHATDHSFHYYISFNIKSFLAVEIRVPVSPLITVPLLFWLICTSVKFKDYFIFYLITFLKKKTVLFTPNFFSVNLTYSLHFCILYCILCTLNMQRQLKRACSVSMHRARVCFIFSYNSHQGNV